mgnify:FL=1
MTRYVFSALPNIITLGRLVLVPVVIAFISQHMWREAFLCFVIAGVSDGIDGWLAKTFNLQTELGAYLDPVADKALLISIYVTLAVIGELPAVIAILVVARDLMIMGAVLISWIVDKPVAIRPLVVSKMNTAAQIGLAAGVLAAKAFGWRLEPWLETTLWIVAALTLASMAAYLRQWVRHMSL